jgi:hypothetical protein
MVSTISFTEANLQHSIAASGLLTRTVVVKGIYMALIWELRYRVGHIMSLNIPGYTLFYVSSIDRPRECILARNMNTWMLPGFSCSSSHKLQ